MRISKTAQRIIDELTASSESRLRYWRNDRGEEKTTLVYSQGYAVRVMPAIVRTMVRQGLLREIERKEFALPASQWDAQQNAQAVYYTAGETVVVEAAGERTGEE